MNRQCCRTGRLSFPDNAPKYTRCSAAPQAAGNTGFVSWPASAALSRRGCEAPGLTLLAADSQQCQRVLVGAGVEPVAGALAQPRHVELDLAGLTVLEELEVTELDLWRIVVGIIVVDDGQCVLPECGDCLVDLGDDQRIARQIPFGRRGRDVPKPVELARAAVAQERGQGGG